jgi:hypothetical protein
MPSEGLRGQGLARWRVDACAEENARCALSACWQNVRPFEPRDYKVDIRIVGPETCWPAAIHGYPIWIHGFCHISINLALPSVVHRQKCQPTEKNWIAIVDRFIYTHWLVSFGSAKH